MIFDGFSHQLPDIDPAETDEWLDSFDAVVDERGRTAPATSSMRLLERAARTGVGFPATVSTPLHQHHPGGRAEPWFPGDEDLERRIRAFIRWNAAVMVHRANARLDGIGGHISTYASSARALRGRLQPLLPRQGRRPAGDQVFFQGHASPGIYARAFLEGRLTEDAARRLPAGELEPATACPSYPHPRLMPDFWEFPTVSMGLGPLNAIYQARFNRYLHEPRHQGHLDQPGLGFLGDGEIDEPEALGATLRSPRARSSTT